MLTDRAKEIIDQTEGKMQEALNFLEDNLWMRVIEDRLFMPTAHISARG